MKERVSEDIPLVLEKSEGYIKNLIAIKTGKDKKKMEEKLRNHILSWLKNKKFDGMKDKSFDLAVVIYVDELRYKRQDLDNIAKVVLDSLKKNGDSYDKERDYLFSDDSQVIRLLPYKKLKTEIENADTDSITISFRIHDEKKQMILEEVDLYKDPLTILNKII